MKRIRIPWPRKKGQDPDPNKPPAWLPNHTRVIMDLPRELVQRGVNIYVDEIGGPSIVPPEDAVLADLGRKIAIAYDPNQRGNFPWAINFDLSYTWRGHSFGQEGLDLVRECGIQLSAPNSQCNLNDDGTVTWFAQVRPTALEIVAVVTDTQRQVEEYMRAFWFDKKSEVVRRRNQ